MSRYAKVAYIGILVALALVLQLVESTLPSLYYFAPGVKLGLANIITLIALIYFGFKKAFLVVLLRTFMGAFLSGRLYSFAYSGMGALFSLLVMGFFYWRFKKYFSIQGISILGAVAHNFGQLFVASLLIDTFSLFTYLPILLVSGIITGFFIGFLVKLLEKPLNSMRLGKFSEGQ